MKEDLKRMKALGGRGMYDASLFFACELRVAPSAGSAGGSYMNVWLALFSGTTSKDVGSVL